MSDKEMTEMWAHAYANGNGKIMKLIENARSAEKSEKENARLRDGILRVIERTSCDDTHEFLNRLLLGNENSDLPYRIGGRNDQP